MDEDDTFKLGVSSLVAGYVAGASGVIIGQPFDILKVYNQLGVPYSFRPTNSQTPKTFANSVSQGISVVRGLYRGVLPPLLSTGAISSVSFALFEGIRESLVDRKKKKGKTIKPGIRGDMTQVFIAGTLAGCVTSLGSNPIGVIKLQQQTAATPVGVAETVRSVVRNNGWKGMYRGLGTTLLVEGWGRGVYLGTYTYNKRKFTEYNNKFPVQNLDDYVENCTLAQRMISASTAGVMSWIVSYPFDVVRAKMHKDVDKVKYRTTLECFQKTYYQEAPITITPSPPTASSPPLASKPVTSAAAAGATSSGSPVLNASPSSASSSTAASSSGAPKQRVGSIRPFLRGFGFTVLRTIPVTAVVLPVYDHVRESVYDALSE